MSFPWAVLVGCYRLEITEELLAFIERTFVDSAPAVERDAVRQDALAEAADAEIELTTDGAIVSRSRGLEFFRVAVAAPGGSVGELCFEKATGVPVRVEIVNISTLVAHQSGRPGARFRRET